MRHASRGGDGDDDGAQRVAVAADTARRAHIATTKQAMFLIRLSINMRFQSADSPMSKRKYRTGREPVNQEGA